jgi:senataxin
MENKDIATLLDNLREDPVDNTGVTDQILGRIYNHLLAVSKDKNGKLHWYCQRASSTTIGAASFLLRLFAYDGQEAETWRGHLNTCFVGCCDCIVEFEKVKGSSRMT